jgi:hypothetical protein
VHEIIVSEFVSLDRATQDPDLVDSIIEAATCCLGEVW